MEAKKYYGFYPARVTEVEEKPVEAIDEGMESAPAAEPEAKAIEAATKVAEAAPAAEPRALVLKKVQKKIVCGANFFQTQAVFRRSQVESFMDAVRPYDVPVILGVLLLKSVRMAKFLNSQIPGVQVPPDLLKRLEMANDPLAEGVCIAREIVAWARDFCHGVHLMTFGREDLIPQILAE